MLWFEELLLKNSVALFWDVQLESLYRGTSVEQSEQFVFVDLSMKITWLWIARGSNASQTWHAPSYLIPPRWEPPQDFDGGQDRRYQEIAPPISCI